MTGSLSLNFSASYRIYYRNRQNICLILICWCMCGIMNESSNLLAKISSLLLIPPKNKNKNTKNPPKIKTKKPHKPTHQKTLHRQQTTNYSGYLFKMRMKNGTMNKRKKEEWMNEDKYICDHCLELSFKWSPSLIYMLPAWPAMFLQVPLSEIWSNLLFHTTDT